MYEQDKTSFTLPSSAQPSSTLICIIIWKAAIHHYILQTFVNKAARGQPTIKKKT